MPIELIITNVGFIVSALICLVFGSIVYIKRPKENNQTNFYYFRMSLIGAVWMLSYDIGVNLHNLEASRYFLIIAVLSSIFIILGNIQLVLSVSNRLESRKRFIWVLYGITWLIVIFFALKPETLLLLPKPQLYLPSFFVPGSLYSLQDTFFFFCFVYLIVELILSYRSADYVMRNRLKYFVAGNLFIYGVGLFPEFLLYGIPIDPLPAALIGLYNIPFAYAILKYNLVDLNILARRALGYALSVVAVTLFILSIGYANDAVVNVVPNFPSWLLPLLSGVIAVGLGVFIWNKVKEVDLLKYQFVDVVTHKFRTPLTHIRWSVDNLKTTIDPEERAKSLEAISEAHGKLYQLTDMLLGLSASDDSQFLYKYEPENLRSVVDEIIESVKSRAQDRTITIENSIDSSLPLISADRNRAQFAIQMVIENAITYSKEGGKVEISAEQKKDTVTLSVRDHGIGIAKEDLSRLFSKFYRGTNATRAHTEGLGIGLYLSRDIMRRHGGDLWVESDGLGKGSTFKFRFLVAKDVSKNMPTDAPAKPAAVSSI